MSALDEALKHCRAYGAAHIAEQATAELAAKDAAIEAARVFADAYTQNGLLADKHVTLGDWERLAAALAALKAAKK